MANQVLSAEINIAGIEASTKKLDLLTKNFDALNKKAAQTQGIEKQIAAFKKVESAAAEIERTQKKLFPPALPQKINNGTQALTDFSRVVQDAPFGLIGIGNNITQLADSFGRLKAESGSGKAAFSALVGSLTGPAGLSLAISGIITALTFAQTGFAAWTRKSKEAKEAADEFNKALKASDEGVQKQKAELFALVDVAKGDVGTKEQQVAALDKLNKIIPDSIGQLNSLNIKTEEGARITAAYVKTLQARATAELLSQRIGELSAKQLEDERKLRKDLTPLIERRLRLQKDIAKGAKTSEGGFDEAGVSEAALNLNEERVNELIKTFQQGRRAINKEIFDLQVDLKKQLAESVIGDLADPKKTKADVEDKLKQLDVNLPIRTVTIEGGLEVEQTIGQKFKGLNEQLRDAGFLDQIKDLGTIRLLEPTKLIDVPAFNTELALFNRTLTTQLSEAAKIAASKTQAVADSMKALNTKIKDLLNNAANSAFTGLGEAIAVSIQDSVPFIESASKAIFSVLGDLISGMGKALIEYGVVKMGIDTALAAGFALPGAVAIAAGIAAVAAGQLIKNVPQFANGGVVNGPTMGVLGEANKSEAIIPLDRLEAMMGGAGGDIIPEVKLRGQDIIVAFKRAERRQGRNF